jgi:diguanylate cyclase (GGDEF)-like protein
MASKPPVRRSRFGWLLLLCSVSAVVNLSLVAATGERDFLALAIVPIVLTGLFFSGRSLLFTTAFLFLANAAYMSRFYEGGQSPEQFVRGLVANGFFLAIGAVVFKLRSMSRRIKALNRELTEKNKELGELSLHDHLTGLYNRRYVNDVVYQLASHFLGRLTIPEAQKRDTNVKEQVIAVFMVDIDDFKSINDRYGHAAGDRVLVEISERLRKAVRFDDIVVRWGGEEFLVVCPGVRKGSVGIIIGKLMEEIRRATYVVADAQALAVTVSMGCSTFPLFSRGSDAFSFEEIIRICDAALYLSKETGRDQATFVQPREDVPEAPQGHRDVPHRELIEDRSLFTLETFSR